MLVRRSSGSGSGTAATDTTDATTTENPTGSTTNADIDTGGDTGATMGTTTANPTGNATTTGGSGEVCDDLVEVDFGACATPLGWIFDGEGCSPLSGCDCGEHCDAVFEDATSCAGTCAAAGECNEDLLLGKGSR